MAPQNPMTVERKAIIWHEWRKGTPMSVICRIIDKPAATVFSYLRYHGGIEPRRRIRRLSSLSIQEREEISRGLAVGLSIRSIARDLCRSPSTVSREVKRNRGRSRYRAADAGCAAGKRALRPKPCVLANNEKLRGVVAEKLAEDWSPEQVAGWLKLSHANDKAMQV